MEPPRPVRVADDNGGGCPVAVVVWRKRTPSLNARPEDGEIIATDDADARRVVIINQKLARNGWGNESPVGRNLILDYQQGPYPYEVIGVVGDDRHKGPRSEPVPEIFIPHAQNPYLVMNVIARTNLDPVAVAQSARASALRVDPDQPVHSVTTMDQLLGDAVQLDRFAAHAPRSTHAGECHHPN